MASKSPLINKLMRHTAGLYVLIHIVLYWINENFLMSLQVLLQIPLTFYLCCSATKAASEVCLIRPAFLFLESGGNLPTNWGKTGMNRKNSCLSVSHSLDAWVQLKSENSPLCYRSYYRNITNGNFERIEVLWEIKILRYCSFVTAYVRVLDIICLIFFLSLNLRKYMKFFLVWCVAMLCFFLQS